MLKTTLIIRGLTIVMILFLILMNIPIVLSETVNFDTSENIISNSSSNIDGIADNVSITIFGPALNFFCLDIFWVTLKYNGPSITGKFYAKVTKNDGTKALFNNKFGYELHGGTEFSVLYWRYIRFLYNGHPWGHFDVNVTLYVDNDKSSKIKTAHGQIFIYYFMPWAYIKENDNS